MLVNPDTEEVGNVCFPASAAGDPNADSDADGIVDGQYNCPSAPNTDQSDADNDGVGDVCDDCTDANGDRVRDDDNR